MVGPAPEPAPPAEVAPPMSGIPPGIPALQSSLAMQLKRTINTLLKIMQKRTVKTTESFEIAIYIFVDQCPGSGSFRAPRIRIRKYLYKPNPTMNKQTIQKKFKVDL